MARSNSGRLPQLSSCSCRSCQLAEHYSGLDKLGLSALPLLCVVFANAGAERVYSQQLAQPATQHACPILGCGTQWLQCHRASWPGTRNGRVAKQSAHETANHR